MHGLTYNITVVQFLFSVGIWWCRSNLYLVWFLFYICLFWICWLQWTFFERYASSILDSCCNKEFACWILDFICSFRNDNWSSRWFINISEWFKCTLVIGAPSVSKSLFKELSLARNACVRQETNSTSSLFIFAMERHILFEIELDFTGTLPIINCKVLGAIVRVLNSSCFIILDASRGFFPFCCRLHFPFYCNLLNIWNEYVIKVNEMGWWKIQNVTLDMWYLNNVIIEMKVISEQYRKRDIDFIPWTAVWLTLLYTCRVMEVLAQTFIKI